MAKNKKQKRKVTLKAKKIKRHVYDAVQYSFKIDTERIKKDFPDRQQGLKYVDSLITLFERTIL